MEAIVLISTLVAQAPSSCDPLSRAFQALFAAEGRRGIADIANVCDVQDVARATHQADRGPPDSLDDPADDTPDWTEEDVVHLHWRLLLELRRLPDPETPLEEKLDTLAWALTEPTLDDRPFSFASCVRVVGISPLSPTGYFGQLDIESIRDWLRVNARNWLRSTLARYPHWIAQLIREQPNWVARQLTKNPQWINQQIKARREASQADLFGAADLPLAS
jgi:hypothetical protein